MKKAFYALVLTCATATASMAQPTFSSVFSPENIGPGGSTRLTYTIDNTGNATGATDLAFFNALPANVTIATPANATSDCGTHTLSAPEGGSLVTFAGGSIDPDPSGGFLSVQCTVSLDVTGSTLGLYFNITGDLTSSAGNSGTASDDLNVVATLPGFTKAFSPSTIQQFATSTLTYTIDNSANAARIGNLDFTDTLPTGLVIAPTPLASTTCGVIGVPSLPTVVAAAPGGNQISLDANGVSFSPGFESLAAGATCTVSVDVQAIGVGTIATNPTALLADFNAAGSATASLEVTAPSTVAPTMTMVFIDDPVIAGNAATVEYYIVNGDSSNAATNLSFSHHVGMLNGLGVTGSLVSNTCGGSFSGGAIVSLTGGMIAARNNCLIVVSVDIPSSIGASNYFNSINDLQADLGGSTQAGATASDTLVVQAATTPQTVTATMSFTDAAPSEDTTLTVTITNPNTAHAASGIIFSTELTTHLPFPLAFTLPASACGGGIASKSYDIESQGFEVSGASLAAAGSVGDSCTFTLDVTVPAGFAKGDYTFTSEAIQSTVNSIPITGATTSGVLTVTGDVSLSLSKVFNKAVVGTDGDLEMTLTLNNISDDTNATNISFVDDINAFHNGATIASINNSCGGTVVATTGDTVLDASGIALNVGMNCEITVDLTMGSSVAAATNTITSVSASPSGGIVGVLPGVTATADVSVTAADPLDFTVELIDGPLIAGGTGTLRYTITNNNDVEDAIISSFTHNLANDVAGLASTSGSLSNICGAGSSITGTSFLIYTGGSLLAGGASCTFDISILVPIGALDGDYAFLTSNLVADVGTSDTVSTPFTIATANLAFSKAFGAASMFADGTNTLTFTIENLGGAISTDIAFDDDLDGFISGAVSTGVLSDDCGGGFATATGGLLEYTAGTVAAGASCTISVGLDLDDLTTPDDYTNETTAVSGLVGAVAVSGNIASADLKVFSSSSPSFAKTFQAASVEAGGSIGIRFDITNPVGAADLVNMGFSDDLDGFLTGTTLTSVTTNTCGGIVSGTGTGTMGYSGGGLTANASCSVIVQVATGVTTTAGSRTNTTSALSDSGLEVASAASDSVTINVTPPSFSMAFSPSSIVQNGVSTATFTITNGTASQSATTLAFTNSLPAGVTMTTPVNVSKTCAGGTLSSTASSVTLSGASVGIGASCTVTADVTSLSVGGNSNTSGALTSNLGNSGTTNATLTVVANAVPTANAGSDDTVASGTAGIALDGTGSTANDAGQTLTYAWTQPSGTAVTLSDATAASPTFTAPTLIAGAASEVLVFSLIVNDGVDNSVADTVSITITSPADTAATADAGSDDTVASGAIAVALDGTGSSANDVGQVLT